jgi:hypothetical protein
MVNLHKQATLVFTNKFRMHKYDICSLIVNPHNWLQPDIQTLVANLNLGIKMNKAK